MKVVWRSCYNIQESRNNCKGDTVIFCFCCVFNDIGEEVSDYYEAWCEEIFKKNEMSTMLGEIRYFK